MATLSPVNPSSKGLPKGLPRLSPIDRKIFPDGLRTSGQHPPIESQLESYVDFPKEVIGPTVWKPQEIEAQPEKWIHRWTDSELKDLEYAADNFIAGGTPLAHMRKELFPLPSSMASYMGKVRDDILNGIGFVVFRGLPIQAKGRYKAAVVAMGLSSHIGYLICQNKEGLILGHVTNQGHDYVNHLDSVKISRTNAPQPYHTDESDVVSLLCLAKAESGGISGSCSAHTVWNDLQKTNPKALETLTAPIWYVDRKGEVTDGQEPWHRGPVFYMEPGGKKRIYVKWDPNFCKSLDRFWRTAEIPPLSKDQLAAMDALEASCKRNCIEYTCEVGDLQITSCCQVFHSRSGFVDSEPPAPRRHLLRIWMSTPEHEGGWCLPFHDSSYPKRGGVQVEDTAPVADPYSF